MVSVLFEKLNRPRANTLQVVRVATVDVLATVAAATALSEVRSIFGEATLAQRGAVLVSRRALSFAMREVQDPRQTDHAEASSDSCAVANLRSRRAWRRRATVRVDVAIRTRPALTRNEQLRWLTASGRAAALSFQCSPSVARSSNLDAIGSERMDHEIS